MAVQRANGVVIRFEPGAFERGLGAIKRADAELYKEVRKTIREQGRDIKNAQTAAVLGLQVAGTGKRGGRGSRGSGRKARALFAGQGRYDASTNSVAFSIKKANAATSLRAAAAGTLVVEVRERPSARVRTAGVRIRVRASKMPGDQKRLPKHMNYGRWRHPVFGNPDAQWVTQTALPQGWFDETFKARRGPAAAAIGQAIRTALTTIKG